MSGKNSQDGLTRTSRYLALVLRHKPQAAGITLDSHGWADEIGRASCRESVCQYV